MLRFDWATEFVLECERRGLQIVAITDHHDVAMVQSVADAALLNGGAPYVFPGIEISTSDGAQVLALFDPDSDPAKWARLIAKLPDIAPAPTNDAKTALPKNARLTTVELFKAVHGEALLGDNVLLLPHFGDGGAYKSINADSQQARFIEIDAYGVYVEQSFTELEEGTLNKVYGVTPQWGNRRRGVIVTGDNKRPTYERLGHHPCWIKLGEVTVEGLRQALLADEARIRYLPPVEPSERIVRLRFQSALTAGQPVSVLFNAGFNALIGGRGSGKSSILEYLRFALGRTQKDLPNPDGIPLREREAQLIDETLADGGFVEVELEREGIKETWRRELATRDSITVRSPTGVVTTLTPGAAQERFRARAFYQKGLSTTTSDPSQAADQITGIAAAEALGRRRELDTKIRNSKRDVETALRRFAGLWQAEFELRQARDRVADLKTRIAALGAKLQAEGVSAEHLNVIRDAPKLNSAGVHLDEMERLIDADIKRLKGLASSVLAVAGGRRPEITAFQEMGELTAKIDAARSQASTLIDQATALLVALKSEALPEAANSFRERKTAFETRLAQAMTAQAAHQNLLADNERLNSDLRDAEVSEATAVARVAEFTTAEEVFVAERTKLASLVEERRKVLEDAAAKVGSKSSDMLEARVKGERMPANYLAAVLALIERAHFVGGEDRCKEWVEKVQHERSWGTLADELLDIYRTKVSSGSPSDPAAPILARIKNTIRATERGVTDQQATRVYQNLDDSIVGSILSAVAEDRISLKYINERGKKMPFKQASPGQQASALLELLLRQSAGTLIIDQPEDDLDNRVIMKIVALVRSSKSTRQLIFTTHNPNLVVNGDADKIVALKSGDPNPNPNANAPVIDLQEDGAIETVGVRDAITTIMEGGAAAFELRGRKYHFAEATESPTH